MHPLDGPRLKLDVAKKEIEELERAIHEYVCNKEFNRVSFDRDPETGEEVHVARVSKPPDPVWGIKIGSIAHLMRSALDNLVWQLALLNTTTPYDRGSYPIFLRKRWRGNPHKSFEGRALAIPKKGKNAGQLTGTLQSVRARHRAMIERTQPYRGGNGRGRDPLWLLSQLNNTDKHRTITVVAMTGQYMHPVPVLREKPFFLGFRVSIRGKLPFEDGAELARFPGPVKVKPHYSVQICFGDGCESVASLAVFDTLRSMHKRVVGIIEMFAPEFEGH